MKLAAIPLFLCCAIGGPDILFGQSAADGNFQPPVYNAIVHISTDNGKYKGRMMDMTDSTISIMQLREGARLDIPARLINTIKVKKRFFRSVLLDFSIGTVLTTFFIVGYYWHEGFDNPDDPPFGQALLTGMAFGAGAGTLYGVTEATFFKVRIPVNKSLELFRQHRGRLLKYWLGN